MEGSNRLDFAGADTLYFIKEAPKRLFTRVRSVSDRPYRYVRYRGADGCYCNISELILYEAGNDSLPLRGRVIGTPGCWQNDGSHEYTNVFDGNPYTSFDYKEASGGWAGMDLGRPCLIGMIEYAPRNRDNFVRKGDSYELFCWSQGRWQSLGVQTATSYELNYSVPRNSLLYLKNHTRGKDERIFECRNGEQLFR